MRLVVAVLDGDVAGNLLYGGGAERDHRALTQALRSALDVARVDHNRDEFEALIGAFESALQRYQATGPCPNFGEATESCDCLICRTQTLITEWEDSLSVFPTPTEEGER